MVLYFYQTSSISDFGSLGDGIGGITSPILGLISILLIYLAYTAQEKSNSVLQRDSTRSEINNYLDILSKTLNENLNNQGEDDIADKIGKLVNGHYNDEDENPIRTKILRTLKARTTIAYLVLRTLESDRNLDEREKENYLIIFRTRFGVIKTNIESLLTKVDNSHLIKRNMPVGTKSTFEEFINLYKRIIPE